MEFLIDINIFPLCDIVRHNTIFSIVHFAMDILRIENFHNTLHVKRVTILPPNPSTQQSSIQRTKPCLGNPFQVITHKLPLSRVPNWKATIYSRGKKFSKHFCNEFRTDNHAMKFQRKIPNCVSRSTVLHYKRDRAQPGNIFTGWNRPGPITCDR